MLADVWHVGLSFKNVVAGFEATGIYPVNKSKYPVARFNPNTLQKYKQWDEAGRPEKMEDIAMAQTLSLRKAPTTSRKCPEKRKAPTASRTTTNYTTPTTTGKTSTSKCTCEICLEIGVRPNYTPEGKQWAPAWSLIDSNHSSTPVTGTPVAGSRSGSKERGNTSFEELILSKIKAPTRKNEKGWILNQG